MSPSIVQMIQKIYMTKEQSNDDGIGYVLTIRNKSVSMDDIARNTGISKRTIYEFFEDKETLLQEAIKYHNNTMRKILSELEKDRLRLDVFVLLRRIHETSPLVYQKILR